MVLAVVLSRDILNSSATVNLPAPVQQKTDIVVRGHIEPDGEVHKLQGPSAGGVLLDLLVTKDQKVHKGQILALLEGNATQAASVDEAERALDYSRTLERQISAGAKSAELEAQRNIYDAKNVEYRRAQNFLRRQEVLFSKNMISANSIDTARTDAEMAKASFEQAGNALTAMTEVRSVDREVAHAKVLVDEAALKKARAEYERTILRSPINGTVLSISARPGELIGADGVMRVADLEKLIVIAEVDERLLSLLTDTVEAIVGGALMKHPVRAKVRYQGKEIFRQSRPISDTLMGRDARIIEVELEPMEPLPVVLGGEVEVRFVPKAL